MIDLIPCPIELPKVKLDSILKKYITLFVFCKSQIGLFQQPA